MRPWKGKTWTGSPLPWRPTKIMNMRDLSNDDDFLSHLLVEKLGTGDVPLLVHKMDSRRHLAKTDADDLLEIVRRLVAFKGPVHQATRQAVDDLLTLLGVRFQLRWYRQKQINAFATHALRYFELYHPSGSIEIAHTSRYSHRTGKSELCILATRPLNPGHVITELKGSMAHLTEAEDKELKGTDVSNADMRRDFSVIHSRQMKRNHLFLGPARFVNHDCNNNCELFREGKYITFRVLRPIAVGEEVTAHYGDGYFGRKNRHCLCETCEKNGKGGYAAEDGNDDSGSDSDASDRESCDEVAEVLDGAPRVNERRTRRGVYAVVAERDDSDDSEDDGEKQEQGGAIALGGEVDDESELSSLSASRASSQDLVPTLGGLPTPEESEPSPSTSYSALSLTRENENENETSVQSASNRSTPFKSIISTRRQKAMGSAASSSTSCSPAQTSRPLPTPPLSEDAAPRLLRKTTRSALGLNQSAVVKKEDESRLPTPSVDAGKRKKDKGKGKAKAEDEEPEGRVLRTRPSASVVPSDPTPKRAAKPDVPRGPDGKPLPTCATCQNVLPLISVDSKVVWGLGLENPDPHKRGRKKKEKHECPRCMRHFAIYSVPWPARTIEQANRLSTPQESTSRTESPARRVTHKALPAIDRKLAAAASKPTKRRHSIADERPAKRIKTEPVTRTQVEMSATARKGLLSTGRTRSGRNSMPSVKMQLQTSDDNSKKKRGRPRLSSPRGIQKTEKVARPKSIAVQSQPRDSNGRFGKKAEKEARARLARKAEAAAATASRLQSESARELRAKERGKAKDILANCDADSDGAESDVEDNDSASVSLQGRSSQKRPRPVSDDELDDGPNIRDSTPGSSSLSTSYPAETHERFQSKKPRVEIVKVEEDSDVHLPSRPVPAPAGFKRFSSLFPSPNHFARHSQSLSRSSSISSSQPRSVEGHPSSSSTASTSPRRKALLRAADQSRNRAVLAALTYSPSPVNFARRRWLTSGSPATEDSSKDIDSPIESDLASTSSRFNRDQHELLDGRSVESVTTADSEDDAMTKDTTTSVPRPLALLQKYHIGDTSSSTKSSLAASPYRLWSLPAGDHESSSGEEDLGAPTSPDPSKFTLQRRASFGSNALTLLRTSVASQDRTSVAS
ncbi:hypothetical protein PLICRDRAFT_37760 [Plicaturopsis crispa FD-325 SS-3]|nr:hypothetical protein PLICRDRAFT_37760 [Plicaturopsis crispa FD-325 SS-3]